MKTFVLLFILGLSLSGLSHSACERPIRMLFGPFFSDAFIKQFFDSVLEDVANNTGCEVEYRVSETYAKYHKIILTNEFQLIMIPSIHLPFVEQLDYQHLVSGFGPLDFILLARKKNGIQRIADLKGADILLNGDISTLSVIWRQLAQDNRIENLVNIAYRGNVDQLLIRTLRGQADATITYRGFYDRLPDNLKSKLIELHSVRMSHPGTVVIAKQISAEQRELIRRGFVRHQLWEHERPAEDIVADQYVVTKLKTIFQLD